MEILILVLGLIAITTVLYIYAVGKRGCPNCWRLFSREEVKRKKVRNDVRRSVVQRGSTSSFSRPVRRAWEEWTEKVFAIENVEYKCQRCAHSWTEEQSSLISTKNYEVELPPEDHPNLFL